MVLAEVSSTNMEIYVRLNNSIDKDFAFQISDKDTVNNKIKKIFALNPKEIGEGTVLSNFLVLRPTIFHKLQPDGYYKSVHPGYLTEGGCLLFHYDSGDAEYLEKLDYDKPLVDQLWPGQLIVPKWSYNKKYIWIYALLMAFWLYTDLPDRISPTPGISLSNNLSRLLIIVFEHLENYDLANQLREEIQVNYNSAMAQYLFFALHVLKIAVLTLFFSLGMANPISFNPFTLYKVATGSHSIKNESSTHLLKSLGWVGAKRGLYEDYRNHYYNYQLEKYGGKVGLFQAGVIRDSVDPGMELHKGEGFQTPLSAKSTISTFEVMASENPRFLLSEEYFLELERTLEGILDKYDGDLEKIDKEVARYRRFGLYETSDKLKEMVKARKAIYLEERRLRREKEKEAKSKKWWRKEAGVTKEKKQD